MFIFQESGFAPSKEVQRKGELQALINAIKKAAEDFDGPGMKYNQSNGYKR
ncbi:TPA: hypothetical protein HA225_06355 [Candidatus Micrarchaeota archaeon]|nr:hypothetical protein [Candidatus Micrarchaeota archaeon]HIH30397.1 hypothetical protein [Candidatus Micrarchaeota archaeon]